MRRSAAPSVRNEKRQLQPTKSPDKKQKSRDESPTSSVNLAKRLKGEKLAFNIMWREQTAKKHKTWQGNGVLEVQLEKGRAVLTDDTGKYLGSTDKYKVSELIQGFQMRVGSKEIELQEQIVDQNEYWMVRKTQVENRGWGSEECLPKELTTKPANKAMAKMSVPKLNLGSTPTIKGKTTKEHVLTISIPSTSTTTHGSVDESLKISDNLAKVLRPHQCEGVIFLYKCLIGFHLHHHHYQGEYYGCLLADEMGLGKTLQVLTVANSLLRYCKPTHVQRVLIVAPRSLVANWNNEINKWLQTERMYGFVVDGQNVAKNRRKLSSYAMQPHVPFVIVSYETLVSQLEDFQALNFDLLICDEGHRIKNPETKTYQALRSLNIKRCVLMTGTPVQNVLSEFFALADFINPGILGTQTEFRRHFENAIEMGQLPEATEEEKILAQERSLELKEITSHFLLRRLQDVNLKHLPSKREYICFLCPSKLQHLLLRKVTAYYEQKKESMAKDNTITPLELISILRKICNHPCLLRHSHQDNPLTRTLARHVVHDLPQLDAGDSSKLLLVENLLKIAVGINSERIVLVSYHTKTLDVLQKLCDKLNFKYLRLDGATSTTERNKIVSKFNDDALEHEQKSENSYILLLSAKAGGVGLNLIGASRLVLYDIDWNPANDAQALSRIWREGQQRDVHIYRLITAGCIEEKIFKRQITKANLGEFLTGKENVTTPATKVTSMKFTTEELKDLFQLQYDFNICDTHQSLKCNCDGNGENQLSSTVDDSVKQFNELSGWHHWKPGNANETFMKDACFSDVKDEFVYIFSNDTVNNSPKNVI